MKTTIEKAQDRKDNLLRFINQEVETLKSNLITRLNHMDEGEIYEMTEFITQRQAASILGVSVPTLRRYTKMGVFKQHRLGTKVYYREDEIYGVYK